jgi:hypothetical protein
MELIQSLQPWHWFVLSLLLFGIEIFATAGFFIGIAAAALVMSVVLFIVPSIAWGWQLGVFGVLSVVLTLAYSYFFRGVNQRTDNPLLNNRAAQLVGTRLTLQEDIAEKGAVVIGDTRWQAQCAGRLARGTEVEVTAVQGMTLQIEAVS